MATIKLAATVAGLLLISAAPQAIAFSTESDAVNSNGTSQIVDPDDQLDEMEANPPANSNQGDTLNLGAPIRNDRSISIFQRVQPQPAGGLPPCPATPAN